MKSAFSNSPCETIEKGECMQMAVRIKTKPGKRKPSEPILLVHQRHESLGLVRMPN